MTNGFATGGFIHGPDRAPDALHMSREQVITPEGRVLCVTYWEPLWWPEDGSPHPIHGELKQAP
jgi:hypothetical protein